MTGKQRCSNKGNDSCKPDRIEHAEIEKKRPKNEKNVFAGDKLSKMIEDDHTAKPKYISRAEKFAVVV